jgi:hypothetical protein
MTEALAAVLPLTRREPVDDLIHLAVVNARGLIIITKIWEKADGRRWTDSESFEKLDGQASRVARRITELGQLICHEPLAAELPPRKSAVS